MSMDLNEWKIIIDSSSSIWIAGMATIQALAVVATLFFAYEQYRAYLKKKFRSHALKVLKYDTKIVEIQNYIFDSNRPPEESYEYDEGYWQRLSMEEKLVYNKSFFIKGKIDQNKILIDRLNLKMKRNLLVFNDPVLNELFENRKRLFAEIIKKSNFIYNQFYTLKSSPGLSQKSKNEIRDSVLERYFTMCKDIGSDEEGLSVPSILIVPPYGLMSIDYKFLMRLEEFL